MQYLGAILKMPEWSQFFPWQIFQHQANPRLCLNHWCWRSWSWPVPWRPTRPSRMMTKKKDVLFIIGDGNAKVGSQEIPGVTGKFGFGVQNEAGQKLTEFCQEKALVIANTLFQQHEGWLYTWTSPDGQNQNQIDYILRSQRWSSIQSAKTRPGADRGSDDVLLIAQFRLKWKKVGKFGYNLNSVGHSSITKI